MSAATDDVPVYVFPEHIRRRSQMCLVPSLDLVEPAYNPTYEPTYEPASAPLRRPQAVPVPVRLTRRGVVVLGVAVAGVAAVLVALAGLSAPAAAGGAAAATVTGNTVAVSSGDSLWSIATRVAPDRDPRAEVAVLQQLNHLGTGAALVPGQVLRIR